MTSGVCVLSLRCMTQCHVLTIMSDRAATKGSKYFKLGRQPHEFFNSKYLFSKSEFFMFGRMRIRKSISN